MVIETVRPFHFRDLGNWTVEQGALWAVVELSLTYSPSFQENNGIPQPERLVVIPYLPTLAIFEEACLALVQSTILYCIWLVSPFVLLAFPMSFALDLFFAYLEFLQSSSLPALAEPKWRVKPPRADGYIVPSACSKEHGEALRKGN
jgi:hypothetical protein